MTGIPLVYGKNDAAVMGAARVAVEAQEKKRITAKIEYCNGYRNDGTAVAPETKGGSGSVSPTYTQISAPIYTHNHPREAGILGGTFSIGSVHFSRGQKYVTGDLAVFTETRNRTMRASAKEGTYSITKGPNFDGAGALKYMRKIEAKADKAHFDRGTALTDRLRRGEITREQYKAEYARSFNTMLVELHNGFMAGASQYGYTYTLERRK